MGEKRDPDQADKQEKDQVWEDLPPEVEYPLRPDEDTAEAKAGRLAAWKKRTATGAILTGIALGMREVLEPNPNEPSIVLETSGQPPRDLPVEADLEDAPPRHSVVKIRPWLLEGADAEKAPPGPADTVEEQEAPDGPEGDAPEADQSRGS